MARVILMQGLPGSGKSTVARRIAEDFRARGGSVVIVSADDFFVERGGGQYAFDPRFLGAAHRTCFERFLAAPEMGAQLVIVDNTNTHVRELRRYYEIARANGAETRIVRVRCDVDVSVVRNSHGVPREVIEGMARCMAHPLPADWLVEEV